MTYRRTHDRSEISLMWAAIFSFFLLWTSFPAVASEEFQRVWSFDEYPKGWQRAAQVQLIQDGKSVHGRWSYGDRQRGWAGDLVGSVEGSTLKVRRCYDSGTGWGTEKPACPNFFAGSDAYFVRKGSRLYWYMRSGNKHKRVYVLTLVDSRSGEHKS